MSCTDKKFHVGQRLEIATCGVIRDAELLTAPTAGHFTNLKHARKNTLLPFVELGLHRLRHQQTGFWDPDAVDVVAERSGSWFL